MTERTYQVVMAQLAYQQAIKLIEQLWPDNRWYVEHYFSLEVVYDL